MKLSIITPAYNASRTLERLYNSLVEQTCKDFEWIIVDDGSTDNTKEIASRIIQENKLDIHYFYKENGGQHTAQNLGVANSQGKYTFTVDSDDYLLNNAVETILFYWNKYKSNSKIGAILFLAQYQDGTIVGEPFKKDEFVSTYAKTHHKKRGDKRQSFLAEAIKKYPFPEFSGERRVNSAQDILIGWEYNYVYINKSIYVIEYLDTGVSRNIWKYIKASPKGSLYDKKLYLDPRFPLYVRMRSMISYFSLCFFLEVNHPIKESGYPFFASLIYPFAKLLFIYRKATGKLPQQKPRKI